MGTLSLLIPLLAGIWVYNDAKKRGHTTTMVLLWAAGTIAMLIVFLPLYLILGRRQPVVKPQRDNAEKTIDVEATVVVEETVCCPMCASKVKTDYKLCPYCGHTMQPKCEFCGCELKREWKNCPNCQQPAVSK
ncbi:zinc ribbon domain-containing protein|uniref:RING-type domain-containing protein n=1 Tax=Dendrosporobacter quercicolus TaxID=146817 RepID=A0A1H0A5N1_9FIRM|nr:zinc ribbon domain-containing protein [Dendrosporobacter quercicolus]NSL50003.1 zinc ribbon domain-containing protein [Dendrosporobacter quercicolus DSM 1736]SDN28283.1 hypothetical protein SAMN04488502_11651 [Dendrosporobacter quercicolus]